MMLGGAAYQVIVICRIHHQDVVEFDEIPLGNLTSTEIADVCAATTDCLLGTRIRWLADVVIVGSRRVGNDPRVEAGLLDRLAKNALRHGRSADISHAHE